MHTRDPAMPLDHHRDPSMQQTVNDQTLTSAMAMFRGHRPQEASAQMTAADLRIVPLPTTAIAVPRGRPQETSIPKSTAVPKCVLVTTRTPSQGQDQGRPQATFSRGSPLSPLDQGTLQEFLFSCRDDPPVCYPSLLPRQPSRRVPSRRHDWVLP